MSLFVVVPVSEPIHTLEIVSGNSQLPSLQKEVGGYIELIHGPDEISCWANEDGKRLQLAVNRRASILMGQTIVGQVILCNRRGKTLSPKSLKALVAGLSLGPTSPDSPSAPAPSVAQG